MRMLVIALMLISISCTGNTPNYPTEDADTTLVDSDISTGDADADSDTDSDVDTDADGDADADQEFLDSDLDEDAEEEISPPIFEITSLDIINPDVTPGEPATIVVTFSASVESGELRDDSENLYGFFESQVSNRLEMEVSWELANRIRTLEFEDIETRNLIGRFYSETEEEIEEAIDLSFHCETGSACNGECGFDLDSPETCGNCTNSCSEGLSCCSGTCTTLDTREHCGECDRDCGGENSFCLEDEGYKCVSWMGCFEAHISTVGYEDRYSGNCNRDVECPLGYDSDQCEYELRGGARIFEQMIVFGQYRECIDDDITHTPRGISPLYEYRHVDLDPFSYSCCCVTTLALE